VNISTARESVLSYFNQPKVRLGMLGSSYVGVKRQRQLGEIARTNLHEGNDLKRIELYIT
jgi:hypothetical protein